MPCIADYYMLLPRGQRSLETIVKEHDNADDVHLLGCTHEYKDNTDLQGFKIVSERLLEQSEVC